MDAAVVIEPVNVGTKLAFRKIHPGKA